MTVAKLTPAQIDKIVSNAHKAAHRYRRRVWWAPFDDMVHEAIAAQIKSAEKFDPTMGINGTMEFGAYTWFVAVRSIKRFLLKFSAPVSAHHRPDVLKGIVHGELVVRAPDGTEIDHPELREDALAAELLEEKEITRAIRERVVQALGEEHAEFAILFFGGEYTSTEVAEANGVTPHKVRSIAKMLKVELTKDPGLRELWKSGDDRITQIGEWLEQRMRGQS